MIFSLLHCSCFHWQMSVRCLITLRTTHILHFPVNIVFVVMSRLILLDRIGFWHLKKLKICLELWLKFHLYVRLLWGTQSSVHLCPASGYWSLPILFLFICTVFTFKYWSSMDDLLPLVSAYSLHDLWLKSYIYALYASLWVLQLFSDPHTAITVWVYYSSLVANAKITNGLQNFASF